MKLALNLLAAVACLAFAGCGDEDDEAPQPLSSGASGATGETGDTGTKAGFIDEANGICADASSELADEAKEQYPEGPPTGAKAEAFVNDVLLPNLQQQHDDIAALTPPDGEESAIDDVLSKLQAGIEEIESDPAGYIEGGGNSDALADASSAAEDFGLTACAE